MGKYQIHRWNRTYFLERGKALKDIKDAEALVDANSPISETVAPTYDLIERMEALYFKLNIALRWSVQNAFMIHNDILEAGGLIQVTVIVE